MTTAFELADQFVDDICAMSPMTATSLGIPGSDDRWGQDFGLKGLDESKALRSRYRPLLEPLVDSPEMPERLAARVMLGSFSEETRTRLGNRFDLRAFHSTVVDHGPMRLDLLREVVREMLPG